MIQIKLLKDWGQSKAGNILNISEKGGRSAVNSGVAEYFNPKKEKKEGIKEERDKWILKDDVLKNNEELAKSFGGISKENFEKHGNKNEKDISKIIRGYMDKSDLAEKIWEVQPYFYDEAKMWWLWNREECKWKIIDDTSILIMVKNNSVANTVESKEKNEIIEAMKQYGREKKPKDIEPHWIQFKDLIVNIKTGFEFQASPQYFVTNPIPWELERHRYQDTPNMDRIFKEWVGEDYVKTLYEILAYSLIPDYPLNRIFCFIGSGMNGKSKYLELLRKFIGESNVCSTELDTLLQSRFEITRLYKKLVCQMGETNFNEMNKTSILKKLSGGDLIGFEHKNKDLIEDKNYAKIIIATNNLPATTDKTIGFYRRWMIVDFPNQFSEAKDILGEIPEEEYNCLAVKCLTLLKELLDERKFHKEGSVEDRIKRYEEKSNPLDKFIAEFYDVSDPNEFVTKHSFSKDLNEWLRMNKFREMSDKSISKIMVEKGFENTKEYIDWWDNGRFTKKQVRVWKGIKQKTTKNDENSPI